MNGGMTNCSFHNRAAVAACAVASSLALLSAAAFGGSCPIELRNPPPACESPVRTCGCPTGDAPVGEEERAGICQAAIPQEGSALCR